MEVIGVLRAEWILFLVHIRFSWNKS